MDWNWFFAAVAQSFAAIVGVVGALLVARLMAHETARREWMRDAVRWAADCNQHQIECTSLQTAWLNDEERQDDDWFRETSSKIHEDEGALPIHEWVIRLIDGFGWFEGWNEMVKHLIHILPAAYINHNTEAVE